MSLIYTSDSSDDEVVYAAVNRKKRVPPPARSLRGKPRGVKTLRTSKDNDDDDDEPIQPSWDDHNKEDELWSMVPPNVDLTWDHYNEVDPNCPDKMVAMAFCCAHCKCDEEKREFHNNRMSSTGLGYWHRHCCHNIPVQDVEEGWNHPLLECALNREAEVPEEEVFTESELKRKAVNATRQATKTLNEDEWEDPISLMASCMIYEENRMRHRQEVGRRAVQNLRPAVVIDAFGGIGAAIVALKRLNIAMSKVIHIEQDMVAMHVARHCHDRSYNKTLPPDGIQEHVYESNFENVFNHLDVFMSKHGPIDIIVGGPPCADFSGLNAYGAGTEGTQGQLLPKFGELINAIQAHKEQQNKPLFFLVENVVFCKEAFKNYDAVDKAIGTTHIIWDAKYFSPCQRNRSYWLNLPVDSVACGYSDAAKISPTSCLEDGWSMAGTGASFDKANTFLASKSRLDADTMIKMKAKGRKFIKGYYSTLERERMMGLPDGYLKEAVCDLFKTLLHALGSENLELHPWSASLDRKFLCFSGEEFKYGKDQHGDVYLKMSPPTINVNREFFSADEYAKHLIGNSFSIPVVEHLLTHLKPLFASREYAGYTYKYRWDDFQK